MTTAKNDAFIFLLGWIDFGGSENIFVGRGKGEMSKFLVGVGTPPIPPVVKNLYININDIY